MNLNEKHKTNNTQKELLRKLREKGYWSRWWGRPDEQACRLYMSFRKDITVYIEFSNAAECKKPELKVWVGNCGQHPNWYISQKRQVSKWARSAMCTARAYDRKVNTKKTTGKNKEKSK